MEHMLQFGVSIDDTKIEQMIYAGAEKQIVENITNDFKKVLFKNCRYYDKKIDENSPSLFAEEHFEQFLDRNKDLIIKQAAELLCEKMYRTKAVKEAVAGVVNNNE